MAFLSQHTLPQSLHADVQDCESFQLGFENPLHINFWQFPKNSLNMAEAKLLTRIHIVSYTLCLIYHTMTLVFSTMIAQFTIFTAGTQVNVFLTSESQNVLF